MSDVYKEAPMIDEGYRATQPAGNGTSETKTTVNEQDKRQPKTHPMEVRRRATDLPS